MRLTFRNALLLLAAATAAALYFTSQATLNPVLRGKVSFGVALAVNLTYYYLWAAVAPLVFLVARRVPVERRRWWRAAVAHIVASVVLTSTVIVAAELILTQAGERPPMPFASQLAYGFAANFHGLLPTYWMLTLGFLAVDFYIKARDREVRAAQLEARLTEARLTALKAQLQPHFLFNTMNSISSLMYEDIEAADAMLARLSDLLRLTIDGDRQVVPLREELDLVRRYLDIERVRFEERLLVEYDVQSAVEGALVPALVLQPLVENAIRHSVAQRERGGRIRIAAAETGGRLELAVEDDGPGLAHDAPPQKGIGLANTEARLAQLYGTRSHLQIANRPQGGCMVRIVIPMETAAT